MYPLHKNRLCLHHELWNSGKVLRRSLTSALNRKESGHAAAPLGVSYAREPMSSLYSKHLCDQVGGSVTRTHGNKRQVKMIKVHPHLKIEAYHDPCPVESLLFRTTIEINCLRSSVGHMIVFGMPYFPSLEEKYKDLCGHDTCYLVLCSKTYDVPTEKLHLVGIRLNYDGLSTGIRIVYHIQQYTQISECDRLANTILATVNRRVTNPQIQLTENPMLIEITPGKTRFMTNGVLYKASSVIDEHNVHAFPIHPAATRGQYLPPNI
jgi:hypothetical protein